MKHEYLPIEMAGEANESSSLVKHTNIKDINFFNRKSHLNEPFPRDVFRYLTLFLPRVDLVNFSLASNVIRNEVISAKNYDEIIELQEEYEKVQPSYLRACCGSFVGRCFTGTGALFAFGSLYSAAAAAVGAASGASGTAIKAGFVAANFTGNLIGTAGTISALTGFTMGIGVGVGLGLLVTKCDTNYTNQVTAIASLNGLIGIVVGGVTGGIAGGLKDGALIGATVGGVFGPVPLLRAYFGNNAFIQDHVTFFSQENAKIEEELAESRSNILEEMKKPTSINYI